MDIENGVYTKDMFELCARGRFPLCVYTVKEQLTLTDLHRHSFFELVIVTTGSGSYRDDQKREYQITTGNVFLLRPGMAHEYFQQNHLAVANVLWIEDELNLPVYDLQEMPGWNSLFELAPMMRVRQAALPLSLAPDELSEIERIVRYMESELRSGEPGSQLMAVGLFSQLLVFLCRCHAQASNPRLQEMQSLDRVLLYMNNHFSEPISRTKLAALAAMSESSFYRHFCRITGSTPNAYLTKIRMNCAEKLLRTTSLSLSEIALKCGFYDGNYFCTIFKKTYGKTPHQYRLTAYSD